MEIILSFVLPITSMLLAAITLLREFRRDQFYYEAEKLKISYQYKLDTYTQFISLYTFKDLYTAEEFGKISKIIPNKALLISSEETEKVIKNLLNNAHKSPAEYQPQLADCLFYMKNELQHSYGRNTKHHKRNPKKF